MQKKRRKLNSGGGKTIRLVAQQERLSVVLRNEHDLAIQQDALNIPRVDELRLPPRSIETFHQFTGTTSVSAYRTNNYVLRDGILE